MTNDLIEKVAKALADEADFDPELDWRSFSSKAHAAIIVVLQDLIEARRFDSSFIEYYARENGINLNKKYNEAKDEIERLRACLHEYERIYPQTAYLPGT